MQPTYNLERFLSAQEFVYDTAILELKNGRKQTHWIWFVFPQVAGLGRSEMARYYALKNTDEAKAYLQHEILGSRLEQCIQAVLSCHTSNPVCILGEVDAVKFHSSLSREIVHQLKYKSREKVGKILAEWTEERLDLKVIKPDLLISVPLHPRKLRERGYNQLHQFTETLSDIHRIPFDHDIVVRNIYKKSQTFKSRERRGEGINVFSLTKDIHNKHILLIDDVFTTGSTMSQLAWEILKNPTNKVSILVMAVDV